jgi:glucokinase
VVFAGGMIAAGEGFLARIVRHVRRLALPVPAARTKICFAQLGGNAGFIGAAVWARQLLRRQHVPQPNVLDKARKLS